MREEEGRPVPARPLERGVGRKELDRIIRRAAELQFHASDGPSEVLSEAEVVRIGEDVGLDTRHIRRALEEGRADALAPELPQDPSPLQRVVGPGRVQLRRVIPGTPEKVEADLALHLRDRESLHPVRSRAGVSIWEPAEGFLPQLQRGLKWKGHRYDLAQARQIEVAVLALEADFSLVTLTLDVRNLRARHGGGYLTMLSALGGAGGLVLGLTALSLPPLGVVTAGALGMAGGAAGGIPAGRRAFRNQVERVRLASEGLLDRLEKGELPPRSRSVGLSRGP